MAIKLSDFQPNTQLAESDHVVGYTNTAPGGERRWTVANLRTSLITGAASTISNNNLAANKVLVSDAGGKVVASNTTTTQLDYLGDVTNPIQVQLNNKQSLITGAATSIITNQLDASRALISDSAGKVVASSITSTQLGYLNTLTGNVQSQLDGKQLNITGAASTLTSSNLIPGRAIITDANGKVIEAPNTSSTHIDCLSSVTSSIQEQLNSKANNSIIATGSTSLRTLADRFADSINVKDFGATGDGSTDDLQAIQNALNLASSNSVKVYLPVGTYMVSDTIRIPSNTYLYGDEGKSSIIKMKSTVGRDATVILTGSRNDRRENIILENFTIDFNRSRWSTSGGTRLTDSLYGGNQDNNACALSVCNSENVIVRNVRCIDGYKHSMDICAPRYIQGNNGATYDPQPSRYVWVENCYFTGGGDDNFTTHHSSDLWIINCLSENPSGVRTSGNSNCYEIDDGTRNVFMSNCVGRGGSCGLQIKGHNYAPAPYNVTVDGLRVVNNAIGVEIRHTGFYGNIETFSGDGLLSSFTLPAGYPPQSLVYVDDVLKTNITDYTITLNRTGSVLQFVSPPPSGTDNIKVYKSESGSLPEILDEDGNPILYTGVSPTARNITLNNIDIIAPREVLQDLFLFPALYGMRIRSYENVNLSNIRISDGSLDLAEDYLPSTDLESPDGGYVARFYNGVNHLNVKNFSIYGFNNVESGFRLTSTATGPFVLDGFTSINGPKNPIRMGSAEYKGLIENFTIIGDQSEGGGVYITNKNVQVGSGFVNGYYGSVVGGLGSTDDNTPAPITYTRTARSTNNDTTTPVAGMQFNWEERTQNLGSGEGIKISWGAKLIDETIYDEFGYIGFEKADSDDVSKASNFVIGNTSNGGAEVTAGSFVTDQRYKISLVADTDFTSIGASSNEFGVEFVATGPGTGSGKAITVATPYLVVQPDGPIRPGTDNTVSLGTSDHRWSVVYAGTGTINTSDKNLKQDIKNLSAAEKRVALVIKNSIKKFKFNDAVQAKGKNARIHIGVIAQDVQEAFKSEGLDPDAYGILCVDLLEDGTTRLGVRYEELLAFVIAAI